MTHAPTCFRIGNDVGAVGRWYRLFLGVFFLGYSLLDPLVLNPMPRGELAGFAGQVGLALGAIVVLYIVVFGAIGEWVLAKVTPWVGTLIFLGVPALLFVLGVLPGPVQMAWGFYISLSLILTFFFRYGGCEVVSLPSMLLGRRYTMYCPLNAIDAVERAVKLDLAERSRRITTVLSAVIVIVVGGYFLLAEYGLLAMAGIRLDIDKRWALLLLIPIANLLFDAWRSRQPAGEGRSTSYALGSGVLGLAVFVFLLDDFTAMQAWRGVMILGAFIAAWQLVRQVTRRLRGPAVAGAVPASDDGLVHGRAAAAPSTPGSPDRADRQAR